MCGGSAAAATGSVLISVGASGGATAIVDGEAVAGKTGAAGVVVCGVPGDVATGGVASLTWWFASAARTVASIDTLSGVGAGALTVCWGLGAKPGSMEKEKCPVT